MDLRVELVPLLVDALALIMSVLIPWATARLIRFLDSRIKSERTFLALERLAEATSDVVEELMQTVVEDLKNDGQFDREEAEQLKRQALGAVKRNLGPKAIAELRKLLALDSPLEVDQVISTKIEAEVRRAKGGS